MTRICLNMIVKNEAACIERALASVSAHISSYCIYDTGSTDGTPDLIRKFFRAHPNRIPGDIYEGGFVNFEQARNDALVRARSLSEFTPAEYYLLMDADMELVVEDPECLDHLTEISYDVIQRAGDTVYANRRFIRADQTGLYRGVTHEYLDIPGGGEINGAWFRDHADGSNRVEKFKRDIKLLLAGLREEPDNVRYWFYLAQSYRDAGDHKRAAQAYKKRVSMGGWDEEVWNAQLNYGASLRDLGDEAGFVKETLAAFNMRPHRAETLYDLAKYYREKGMNAAAVLCAEAGMKVPYPSRDVLFISDYVYKTGLREEYAISAFYDEKKRDDGFRVCNDLALDLKGTPNSRELARTNLFHYLEPLSKLAPSFRAQQIKFTPPAGYIAMNPSVAIHQHAIFTTVRTVNYKITETGHYQIQGGDGSITDSNPIHTRNFLVRMDNDLKPQFSSEIIASYDPQFKAVVGLEDMRLFSWRNGLWFSACARDQNPEGWCEQIYGSIRGGDMGRTVDFMRRMLPSVREHQKNWAPFTSAGELSFMYRLGHLVDMGGATISKVDTGLATEAMSGGSQVIQFNTGWVAIVHEARHKANGQRYYQHRFVWMDMLGKLRKISRPFYLHDKQIEFVAGLARHPNGDFLISYGVRDCEAWIATVNANEIEWVLWHD